MGGLGSGVGSGIDEQAGAVIIGEGAGDAWTLDALESAQNESASRHGGTGVAGGDHGLGLMLFDQVHGHADGGIALFADGIGGGVLHVDDGLGGNNFDLGRRDALFLQLGMDDVWGAYEVELLDLGQGCQGELDAADVVLWGVVAAHDIKGYLHGQRTGRLSWVKITEDGE